MERYEFYVLPFNLSAGSIAGLVYTQKVPAPAALSE